MLERLVPAVEPVSCNPPLVTPTELGQNLLVNRPILPGAGFLQSSERVRREIQHQPYVALPEFVRDLSDEIPLGRPARVRVFPRRDRRPATRIPKVGRKNPLPSTSPLHHTPECRD